MKIVIETNAPPPPRPYTIAKSLIDMDMNIGRDQDNLFYLEQHS